MIRLLTGDCREVLKTLDCSEVRAVITDPPYGIAHPCDYARRKRGALAPCNDWPDVIGDSEPFDPAAILALDVPTVLWGANHFADKLPPSGGWLVWDKERPDDLDQSTCELAWTNCIKGVRRFRHLWNGMIRASEQGESYHPTQKPVALIRWILSLRWMPREGAVLDPYMGSGPVGVACVQMGYSFIGIELDARYYATAKWRIEQAQQQPLLFEYSAIQRARVIADAPMFAEVGE
jgi:site-specific DNA-methyltransferase (adenine-specific)